MLAPHVFYSFLYPVYLKGVALVLAIGYLSSTRIFLAEGCGEILVLWKNKTKMAAVR